MRFSENPEGRRKRGLVFGCQESRGGHGDFVIISNSFFIMKDAGTNVLAGPGRAGRGARRMARVCGVRHFLAAVLLMGWSLVWMAPAVRAQNEKNAKPAKRDILSLKASEDEEPALAQAETAKEGDASEMELFPKLYGDPVKPLLAACAYMKENPDNSVGEYLINRYQFLIKISETKPDRKDVGDAGKILIQMVKNLSPNSEVSNYIHDPELKIVFNHLKSHLDILAINIDSRIEKLKGLFNLNMGSSFNIYAGTYEGTANNEEEIKSGKIVFMSNTGNKRIDSIIKLLGDAAIAEMHIFHNVDNPNWLYELQQKHLKTKGTLPKRAPVPKEEPSSSLRGLLSDPAPPEKQPAK